MHAGYSCPLGKLSQKRLGQSLVVSQFAALGFLSVTGPVIAVKPVMLGIEILGILLGLWAIMAMRISNFRVYPNLKPGAILVTSGPYRKLRHPMYTSLLLVYIPLLINHFSLFRMATFLLLLAAIGLKMCMEEKELLEVFPDYAAYQHRSWRIIPWVY